ncbi:MAG: carboxymuconolactone decarboxylase family protein [Legionella sp.]|uniref:carboxymuconolactone decarboxylase family protein n=1 Tax=Legionella sp. TaxID=459 RepID=UPI0028498779|nr:carboxymuconolactone decarboxylase family protein [Legionella sp.]
MADYHEHADLARLKDLFGLAKPEADGYLSLNKAFNRDDGAIPKKYRELMALAVSFTTQCPYCLEVHTAAAKRAGATREEVAEACFIAANLRAGAAITHGTLALKFYDRS